MQVNNNVGTSFKGLYIIKGTNKRVDAATTAIRSVCNNSYVRDMLAFEVESRGINLALPKTPMKNFTDCAYHYLTGFFGDLQPLTQNLIATNEHAGIIKDFMMRKTMDFDPSPLTIEMLEESITELFLGSDKENEEYEFASNECKKGNAKPLAEFVVQSQIKAKECLNEILEKSGYSAKDIKVLNVDEVLESISRGQFDPMSGKLTRSLDEN